MPLYEYRCEKCGARYEARRRMSQRTEAPECPECGSEATSLSMSASAFVGGNGGGASGGACSTNAWTGGG